MIGAVDDLRIGRIARALRQRLGIRQTDVAARAGLGHDLVSRLERGYVAGMTLGSLRRLFAVFEAEVVVLVRWRGGEMDRLVDRRHAALGEHMLQRLEPDGWTVIPEVSFSEFGERGSIDLLAWHPQAQTLLVVEIKTEIMSVEETIRRHDAKGRLAAKIARDRFGWRAALVAKVLVLPDERTPRRHVQRHEGLFAQAYPIRGWELARWLRAPDAIEAHRTAPGRQVSGLGGPVRGLGVSGPGMSGLIFLANADGARSRREDGGQKRIRAGRRQLASTQLGCQIRIHRHRRA